ncbi:MAG: YlmH/Sll1252 family protein [Eubacteriaceae bacterium]|nr:YlmH/Sll1252 family protein [Eubacteriaceae bacterium]
MAKKEYLAQQVEEAAIQAQEHGSRDFFSFCEPAVQMAVEREIARYPSADCLFFGGHENCERRMMAIFPKGMDPGYGEFPISCIQMQVGESIGHRDVLGAITSLGAERDRIGDIQLQGSLCQVYASEPIAAFLINELKEVGGSSVKPEIIPLSEAFATEPVYTDISATVSSMRADTLLHAAFKMSRQEASDLIKNGKVLVNHKAIAKASYTAKEGDLFSVRSKGRLLIGEILGTTKKGNIRIILRKLS